MPLPWKGFLEAALFEVHAVKISKSEQKRGRGAGHANTVRRVVEDADGGRILYERRPIHRLRQSDLNRIPDPEVNAPLVRSLAKWMDAGSPVDQPPISPQGDPIRHVRVKLIGKTGISRDGIYIRGGLASYKDLVRVDLYEVDGKYAVVPIHAVDVATSQTPPVLSPVNGKLRKDWRLLTNRHRFLFSIYRNSLLRFHYRDGRGSEGFFRGLEQRTIRLTLADVLVPTNLVRVPVGLAAKIEKFQLDRMGRRFPVRGEVRTWRGENSPWPIREESG